MLTVAIMKYSLVFLTIYMSWYIVRECMEVWESVKHPKTKAAEDAVSTETSAEKQPLTPSPQVQGAAIDNRCEMIWIGVVFLVAVFSMGAGGYFFTHDVYKTTRPMLPGKGVPEGKSSVDMNKPCVIWMFDNHDVWHFLSAIGLGTMIWVSMLLDRLQENTPRNEMAIF